MASQAPAFCNELRLVDDGTEGHTPVKLPSLLGCTFLRCAILKPLDRMNNSSDSGTPGRFNAMKQQQALESAGNSHIELKRLTTESATTLLGFFLSVGQHAMHWDVVVCCGQSC